MDLNDLYKLAGISRDDAPAIEPQPVEQVAEQPTDGREDMRAMIALITPDQLNQLVGEARVEEGDEYAASTTPNPQEYKGTLGSPSDNSLRRYLGAAGDHVTVDEDVYPDHTVESVSEAYQSFKAEGKYGKKKKYDEESIQESSADEFLKSLNQDPLYFPGAQITKNDDGSITLVASNGEEVGDIDVKTGDIVLVNGDDYNIADDEDAEQNLQTMYAEINGDNGDMDMDGMFEDAGKVGYMEMFFTDRDGGEVSQEVQVTLADGKLSVTGDMPGPEDDLYWDDADIEEQLRDAMKDMSVIDFDMNEADVEENAFNQAAAAASRAGKANFEFGGKTHKTTMKKDTAHKLDDDINRLRSLAGAESAVTEDPSKPNFPMQIELAGDSIWDKEDQNPRTVTVTDYNMDKDEEGYVSVTVEHDGPWTVYTDSGFEKEISEMIGMDMTFSEQGMQEDGMAHLEGTTEMESTDITTVKKLAGI